MDSWLVSHEFEPSAAEYPLSNTLNLSKYKHLPVGVKTVFFRFAKGRSHLTSAVNKQGARKGERRLIQGNKKYHKSSIVIFVLSVKCYNTLSYETNIANYRTATTGSDVVQSGRPIFYDFFQHLWPYIGNNTANVVFQMVKRLWLIRIDQ
ncbi:hypothetical protein TNCV_4559811 [Trichonephila clavipes]|nr:hypothetical protein TNCV_4559811 [Trichonephila clavipes]